MKENTVKIALIAFIVLIIALTNKSVFNPFGNLNIEQSRGYYKEAKSLQDEEDYKAAYYKYDKISENYKAYDIVLFQQAICTAGMEDEKTTIKKYKKLISRYPQSPFTEEAHYRLAQAYVRTKNKKDAEKQFDEIIKKHSESDFAIGSYYYLGELNSNKKPKKAKKYWLKYIENAPDGKFSMDCVSGIKALNLKLSAKDKMLLGKALYSNQEYKEALKYLQQAHMRDAWFYIAVCQKELGNTKVALNTFSKGLTRYSSETPVENILLAMQYYVNLSPAKDKDDWTFLISFAQSSKDFAMYQKAQIVDKSERLNLYNKIFTYYPDSNYASEALWFIFWDKYNTKNYNQAIKLGEKHIQKYSNTLASPKILFWLGKIYEKKQSKVLAKSQYEKLLNTYTDSYYAFRANGRINAINGGHDNGWTPDKNTSVPDKEPVIPYSYDEIAQSQNIELAELIEIEDYDTTMKILKDSPFIESWIKYKENTYTKSIVLARNAMEEILPKPDFSDKRWMLIYPIHYADYINHYSKLNRLDPYIILSLIKEESHFNPIAVSSSGAKGLMQLMPATASDVARWKGYEVPGMFSMFTPETNIKFGTAYFKHVEETTGRTVYAVGAYNGGPNAVQRWLNTISSSDTDEFIENIPYDQTRQYIQKVYRSYWNYNNIYNKN